MKKETFGNMVVVLRKEKGMTQLELAEKMGVTDKAEPSKKKIDEIVDVAFKGVALAMGIAVVVLSVMKEIEMESAMAMLGIGLTSLAISSLSKKENN